MESKRNMHNNYINISNIEKEIMFYNRVDELKLLSDNFFECKYFVRENKQKYLLVITSINNEKRIFEKANFLLNLNSFDINTHLIISYGKCKNPNFLYVVYNWIDGLTLENYLQKQDYFHQYNIGVMCGEKLKSIHDFTQTKSNNCIISNDIKECLSKKDKYAEFKSDFPYISIFFDELAKYKNKVFDREILAHLHGDFKISNIIIRNNTIYLIDWVYGEKQPAIKEFVRNLFNSNISKKFAKGLIDGYFRGSINNEMWEQIFIFSIIHQLELLDWIGLFDFITSDFVTQQHQNFLIQYNDLKTIIPLYYREEKTNESK